MSDLNNMQIRKLKPRVTRYEMSDGRGLSLRITPSGAKSWIYRYRFDGTARRMTLGAYPGISLAEARKRHTAAVMDVQKGVDPGAKAKAAKARRKASPTVKGLLKEFWDIELGSTPSGKERRRMLEKDVMPTWANKKARDITRRDAVLLLDAVRARAPITANRLQGVLVRMFNFAAERGIIDVSPLVGLRLPREESRSRVLSDDEIKALWKVLDQGKNNTYLLTRLALKMILLTGQRPGEVCGMAWNQIADGWWIMPAETRKNREENRVPLAGMALDVIERARVFSGESPFVFASPRAGVPHLKPNSIARSLRGFRADMGIKDPFTPHDLRRTFRTRLAALGVSDIVAERVLGHKLQGVLGIYNRHSYDLEKRKAVDLWEQRLKEILGLAEPAGNVIPLEVARGN